MKQYRCSKADNRDPEFIAAENSFQARKCYAARHGLNVLQVIARAEGPNGSDKYRPGDEVKI